MRPSHSRRIPALLLQLFLLARSSLSATGPYLWLFSPVYRLFVAQSLQSIENFRQLNIFHNFVSSSNSRDSSSSAITAVIGPLSSTLRRIAARIGSVEAIVATRHWPSTLLP